MRLTLAVGAGLILLPFIGCGRSSDGSPLVPETLACVASPRSAIDTEGVDFAEVARERGLLHVWPRQPRPMSIRDAFGCGCAAFDYDNDGRQDVLLVADPHPVLYRNAGDGHFENVTNQSGLLSAQGLEVGNRRRRTGSTRLSPNYSNGRRARAGAETRLRSDWTGVAVGDYDGDGWLDVLLTGFQRLALFKNDGNGTFVDVTSSSGLDPANRRHWGTSAGFMDLDGDGLLDLAILNYVVFGPGSQQHCEHAPGVVSACPPQIYPREKGELWRNAGQGRFEPVAESDGMHATSGAAMVLTFTDLDDDNRPDVYIGNDGPRADFLHNLGGMRFNNVATQIGVAVGHEWLPMAAMGADWADFNRDGLLDLTVTDFQKSCFALFRHDVYQLDDGGGWHSFHQVGAQAGISSATRECLGFGAKWLDMDNDSWPDLCYANGHVYDNAGQIKPGETLRQAPLLLRNEQGERFVDLLPALDPALAEPIVGRGSATADFDNDGRIDVLL
ncbi:MAG TPA: VCBS repeat-containing protein, partial [Pirellulales bacterium]|nr:VCBS repeat-containing protein [Pirellulales bacterium]